MVEQSGLTTSSADAGGETRGGTETSTSGGDGSAETAAIVDAGCTCIADDPPLSALPTLPTCHAPICDVVASCPEFCVEGSAFELADPTELECALMALRDRTPGVITWDLQQGAYRDEGYLLILSDGRGVRRNWGGQEPLVYVSESVFGDLLEPKTFEECLDETDDFVGFECIRHQLGGLEICNASWTNTD